MGDGTTTCREAGRRGGLAVVAKHPGHHSRIGKLGGAARRRALGPEGLSALGKRGGAAVKAKYGLDHYRRMGRLGGAAPRKASA